VRAGSVTGEMLGQFDVTPSLAATTPPGVVQIKTPAGVRDLYVIVRNATAKPEEMTVSIATITFVK